MEVAAAHVIIRDAAAAQHREKQGRVETRKNDVGGSSC